MTLEAGMYLFIIILFFGFVKYLGSAKRWETIFSLPKRIIDWYQKKQRRKDLMVFVKKWFSDDVNLSTSSGRLNVKLEEEFGDYCLQKLIGPLTELKICTLSRAKNYWVYSNFGRSYSEDDVRGMISDIKSGVHDQSLT